MYISGSHSGSSGTGLYISGSSGSGSFPGTTLRPHIYTTEDPHSDAYYRMQDAITIMMLVLMFAVVCMCCVYSQEVNKKEVYTGTRYHGDSSDYDSD